MSLPHLNPEFLKSNPPEPAFTTMQDEIARVYQFTHPNYTEPESKNLGNAVPPRFVEPDIDEK